MKMLSDAVNHSILKKQIIEEVKSEQSKKGWRESSSEDLYSDAGEGYILPEIDPEKLNIAAIEDQENDQS